MATTDITSSLPLNLVLFLIDICVGVALGWKIGDVTQMLSVSVHVQILYMKVDILLENNEH
jgi:hypothetical protein